MLSAVDLIQKTKVKETKQLVYSELFQNKWMTIFN